MDLFGKNKSMIIFFIVLFLILYIKIKIHIFFQLKNTDIQISIKTLFIKYEIYKKLFNRNTGKKNNSFKKKLRNQFIKVIKYEILDIEEEIGVGEPILTSLTLPVLSVITLFPLHFYNINYKKFKYTIIPNYNEFSFILTIDTVAYFRIIDLFYCIFRIIMHKLYKE